MSWLTALGLIATVVVSFLQLGPEGLGLYLLLLVSGDALARGPLDRVLRLPQVSERAAA